MEKGSKRASDPRALLRLDDIQVFLESDIDDHKVEADEASLLQLIATQVCSGFQC